MKHPIKYRIWSKLLNKFVSDLSLENLGHVDGTLNELFEKNNLIFQRFTGILDKEGKEVYEGDVLKYGSQMGWVEFFSGCYYCCWSNQTESELGYMTTHYIELIGNIFESKELLV